MVNPTSADPAFLRRHSLEFLDFRAESDTPVSVRLVPHMHNPRRTAHLLRGIPVTSAGIRSVASMGIPTCRGADEAKKKPATRDVKSFRKMFRFVRSYP